MIWLTKSKYYNILNIVVNTEQDLLKAFYGVNYNILNIVVNTEPSSNSNNCSYYYNILNIVVNTELGIK